MEAVVRQKTVTWPSASYSRTRTDQLVAQRDMFWYVFLTSGYVYFRLYGYGRLRLFDRPVYND